MHFYLILFYSILWLSRHRKWHSPATWARKKAWIHIRNVATITWDAMNAIVNTHPINAWLHVDLKIDSNVRILFEMQSVVIREAPKFSVNFSFCPTILLFRFCCCCFFLHHRRLLSPFRAYCLWIYLSRNRNNNSLHWCIFYDWIPKLSVKLNADFCCCLVCDVVSIESTNITSTKMLSSHNVLPLLTTEFMHKFHAAHTLFANQWPLITIIPCVFFALLRKTSHTKELGFVCHPILPLFHECNIKFIDISNNIELYLYKNLSSNTRINLYEIEFIPHG